MAQKIQKIQPTAGINMDLSQTKYDNQGTVTQLLKATNIRISATKEENSALAITSDHAPEVVVSGYDENVMCPHGIIIGSVTIGSRILVLSRDIIKNYDVITIMGITPSGKIGNVTKYIATDDSLGFSKCIDGDSVAYKPSFVTSYETEEKMNVYWVLGYGSPLYKINLKDPRLELDYQDSEEYVMAVRFFSSENLAEIECKIIPGDYFEYLPKVHLNDRLGDTKMNGGSYRTGTSQFAVSYITNGIESNLLDVTELEYNTPFNDRAVGPDEETEGVSYKLDYYFNVNDLPSSLDSDGKSIEKDLVDSVVFYSIYRAERDGTPVVRRKIVDKENIRFSSGNQFGVSTTMNNTEEEFPYEELLGKNNPLVLAKTITQKDGVLFLGNIEAVYDKNIDGVLENEGVSESTYKLLSFDSGSITLPTKYSYKNQIYEKGSYDATHFKYGEKYMLGYQVQDKYGYWSEPIILSQKVMTKPIIIDDFFRLPVFEATFARTDIHKVRPLIIFPNQLERNKIMQGFLNPTIYNEYNRYNNGSYCQASPFMRPRPKIEIYNPAYFAHVKFDSDHALDQAGYKAILLNSGSDVNNDTTVGNGLLKSPSLQTYNNHRLGNEQFGHTLPWKHLAQLAPINNHCCEFGITGFFTENRFKTAVVCSAGSMATVRSAMERVVKIDNSKFFVDASIVTFNSPDVEFLSDYNTTDGRISCVGVSGMTSFSAAEEINATAGYTMKNSRGVIGQMYSGFGSSASSVENYSKEGCNAHVASGNWSSGWSFVSPSDDMDGVRAWGVYPFNRKRLQSIRHGEDKVDAEYTTSVLNYKLSSNLRYSAFTAYVKSLDLVDNIDIKCTTFNGDVDSKIFQGRHIQEQNSYVYDGNVNMSVFVNAQAAATNIWYNNARVLPTKKYSEILFLYGKSDVRKMGLASRACVVYGDGAKSLGNGHVSNLSKSYIGDLCFQNELFNSEATNPFKSPYAEPSVYASGDLSNSIFDDCNSDVNSKFAKSFFDTPNNKSVPADVTLKIQYNTCPHIIMTLWDPAHENHGKTIPGYFSPSYYFDVEDGSIAGQVYLTSSDMAGGEDDGQTARNVSLVACGTDVVSATSSESVCRNLLGLYYGTGGEKTTLAGNYDNDVFDKCAGYISIADIDNKNPSDITVTKDRAWYIAGPAINPSTTANPKVLWKNGDWYYKRYDCLRVYPHSSEDMNQCTEIVSVMLETKVNLDGRYDQLRGVPTFYANRTNFNKINMAYTQDNNFFSYTIVSMNDDISESQKFPNKITWSRNKVVGSQIDTWGNLSMVDSIDLDGDNGEIVAIDRFKDKILCFQPRGVSEILYNSRTQIPQVEGQPIEIANTGKVDGKAYFKKDVGITNMNQLSITDSGIYIYDPYNKAFYNLASDNYRIGESAGMYSFFQKFGNKIELFRDYDNESILISNNETVLSFNERLGFFETFQSIDKLHGSIFINGDMYCQCFGNNYSLYKHSGSKYFNDSEIEFVSGGDTPNYKIFDYIELYGDVSDNPLTSPITDICVYNEYQNTGKVRQKYDPINPNAPKKKFRAWRYQVPRDVHSGDKYGHRTYVKNRDRISGPYSIFNFKWSSNSYEESSDKFIKITDIYTVFFEN